jgi:hypothetical protein
MRLYTPDQAQALLKEVVPVVEQIREAFLELRALQASLAAGARSASGDGNLVADPWSEEGSDRVAQLNAVLRSAAAQLDGWGTELKDPEQGLIDFYWEREGEVVYLCYRLGEPELAWWHRLADGFAGRQAL